MKTFFRSVLLFVAAVPAVIQFGCRGSVHPAEQPSVTLQAPADPLDRTLTGCLVLDSVPLSDAVARLSAESGVAIDIDRKALDDLEGHFVKADAPVNGAFRGTTFRAVLQSIIHQRNDALTLDDLPTPRRITPRASATVVERDYDVSDLLATLAARRRYYPDGVLDAKATSQAQMDAAQDDLTKLITESVLPDDWCCVTENRSLRLTETVLQVSEISAGHRLLRQLLEALRHPERPGVSATPIDAQLTRPLSVENARTLAAAIGAASEAANLSVVVDWTRLAELKLAPTTSLSGAIAPGPICRVLLDTLKAAGVAKQAVQVHVADGICYLTQAHEWMPPPTRVRVFDISGILLRQMKRGISPATTADQIARAVMEQIDPDSWRDAGGSAGMLRVLPGLLVVSHYDETLARVTTLLQQPNDGALHDTHLPSN